MNCAAVVDQHGGVGDFGHLGINMSTAGGSVLEAGAWMQARSALGYGSRLKRGEFWSRGGSGAMTLSDIERGTLRQTAKACFEPDVVLRLFGSRQEDSRKREGGDLLVETRMFDVPSITNAHLRFLSEVCVRLGEQKVDVLIDYPGRQQSSPVFEISRTPGGAVNDVSPMPQDDALKAAYLNEVVAPVPEFEKPLARVSAVIDRIR